MCKNISIEYESVKLVAWFNLIVLDLNMCDNWIDSIKSQKGKECMYVCM